ncbi:hypothetical protein CVT24_011665 [Panaeolus cyanescens]|uniref:BTB domain-containing protein n=1 Tax=Panaeolus cyanescens TaxID=181874 RepID=A0A409YH23_9AGAR|nr:hypothetical protein CVT24_011665 [Panaeolus cyanescens]
MGSPGIEPIPISEFFYETVYIQVSNELYLIPKEHLNVPDTVFAQMFEDGVPSESSHGREGAHRKNPIVLEGIDPTAFRAFLKAIWKRDQLESSSPEDWANILRLANLWNFKETAKEAKDELFRVHANNAYEMLKLGNEFQVANDLYSVPKEYINIPGTVFAQMFEEGVPSDSSHGLEGTHRKNPIVLQGVDPTAFRGFLKAVWKRDKLKTSSPEEWINILRLAHLWNFRDIKKEAKAKVFNARSNSAFDMLKLGHEFQIKDWVIRGYAILSHPSFMFSIAPLIENGFGDKIAQITRVREALRFYSMQNFQDVHISGAMIRLTFECTSCRSLPPTCTHNDYYDDDHGITCATLEIVTSCRCGEVVYPHRGASLSLDKMSEAVVEYVFKDDLKHFE